MALDYNDNRNIYTLVVTFFMFMLTLLMPLILPGNWPAFFIMVFVVLLLVIHICCACSLNEEDQSRPGVAPQTSITNNRPTYGDFYHFQTGNVYTIPVPEQQHRRQNSLQGYNDVTRVENFWHQLSENRQASAPLEFNDQIATDNGSMASELPLPNRSRTSSALLAREAALPSYHEAIQDSRTGTPVPGTGQLREMVLPSYNEALEA